MSDFAPGDVVVCVDNTPNRLSGPGMSARMLKVGAIYRVRAVRENPVTREMGVFLQGIIHPIPLSSGIERGWLIYRFRKLPKADEQFTQQMRSLKPVKVSSNV